MADPSELVGVGAGGAGIGALLMGLLKFSGSRNIAALDKTLAELTAAVVDLRKEVQHLREAHVALAKDIGALQKDNELLRARLDGLAKHWAEKFEDHRRIVDERLNGRRRR